MDRINAFVAVSTFAALMVSGAAAQQTPGGALTNLPGIINSTATGDAAQSETIEEGAVTALNVSSTQVTNKWAGFFGNVSGSEILGDGSGNTFFQWTGNQLADTKVFAVPKGNGAPAGTDLDAVDDPNDFLGSEYDSGIDNASGTFTQDDQVSTLGKDISTAEANTFDNDNNAVFETFLLEDTTVSSEPGAVYVADGEAVRTGFRGNSTNYQIIVGVGESSSQKAFSFYAELP